MAPNNHEDLLPLNAMPRASDVHEDLSRKSLELNLGSRNDTPLTSTHTRSTSSPTTGPDNTRDRKKILIPAAVIIPTWMALSISIILFNKYLFASLKFPYPVFLTTYHMAFSACGTRLLQRTTNLLDGVNDVAMTREKWMKTILPIGALFSGSLILSNYAYLSLSVSFIQMLKAFNPVAILLISFAFKIQEPSQTLFIIVMMISGGCALAAYGELHFELVGFMCQCAAVVFEASRLVMIQILLHGLKMDPLVSLHYYAPVCAVINACIIPFTEGWAPFREIGRIGVMVFFANASIAFSLNVAAVFLIAVGSGLILTLAGVVKDILLISGSVLMFGSQITMIQVLGYGVALGGLVLFRQSGHK